MTLNFSVTDFISDDKGLVPIIKAEISNDNTVSLFCDKENKASVQCARFERLAKEVNTLIKSFYSEEIINSQSSDKV